MTTLSEKAAAGDRLETLKALRDVVAQSIEIADAGKRAPLVRQLTLILAEIATLSADDAKVGDPVDEIAARRAARGGATSRLG